MALQHLGQLAVVRAPDVDPAVLGAGEHVFRVRREARVELRVQVVLVLGEHLLVVSRKERGRRQNKRREKASGVCARERATWRLNTSATGLLISVDLGPRGG